MAGTPQFKVYIDGVYVAACMYPEDAAAIIGANGRGEIRFRHSVKVWVEGKEAIPAAESYDVVAETIDRRVTAYRLVRFKRYHRYDGCRLCIEFGVEAPNAS